MADPVDFKEDVIVYPVMLAMIGCLTAELEASGLEVPSFMHLAPGTIVALEHVGGDDGCAQAWVRLSDVFPSVNFPNPDSTTVPWPNQMAFGLEVGIVRCVPTLDESGNGPDVAQYMEQVRQQTADMAAMRRAICKCLNSLDRQYLLGSYLPYGEGAGNGGWWQVTVRWMKGGD